jgi:hypothetical protein
MCDHTKFSKKRDFSNFKQEINSSDVPSAPHNIHHLIDVLSGIGTI